MAVKEARKATGFSPGDQTCVSRALDLLYLAFRCPLARGVFPRSSFHALGDIAVAIGIAGEKESALVTTLSRLAAGQGCKASGLAELVENKEVEKFDYLLGDQLLSLAWARDRIDAEGLPVLARGMMRWFEQT